MSNEYSEQQAEKRLEVLLCEDNVGDQRLTLEAFKDSKLYNKLHIAADGVEALAFLRKEGKYANVPTPDLILLDLNMPRKDGREALAEIKADKALKRIPVVILTTSQEETDIVKTYNLHANCFITKPVDLDQFLLMIKNLENFWFSIVKLPPKYSQEG